MTRRCNRGFTLIEVLVALVIVAVGMSAMMGALSSSARTVVYLQDKNFAEWVALNQITNTRLQLGQGQLPATGSTNGDIEYANRSWHWRQDVIASQVPGIVQIHAKVRPKEVKGGDDDSWYVEVVGLAGNGMAQAGSSETAVNWDPTPGSGGVPGGNNRGTNLNQNGITGSGSTNPSGLGGTTSLPGGTTPTPTPTPTPGLR
jgi:general secretion pathway protein I